MATQQTTTLIDHIDGGKADETVAFGLDGARFEIDLNRKKAAALRKSLAGFVAASRVVKPESTMRRQNRKAANGQASGPLPAQIRSWAVGQGIEVPARGRIPETVRAQYLSTHAE